MFEGSVLYLTTKRTAEVILSMVIKAGNRLFMEEGDHMYLGFEFGENFVHLYKFVEELVKQSQVDFVWDEFPVEVHNYEDFYVDTRYSNGDRMVFVRKDGIGDQFEIHVGDYREYPVDQIKGNKIVYGYTLRDRTGVSNRPMLLVIPSIQDITDIDATIASNKTI